MDDYLYEIKQCWNETADSDWYKSSRTNERIEQIIRNPQSSFHPTTFRLIEKAMPNLSGKRILVPSSGDNHAVFSFALLGAKATSTDISERQLENASSIARKHNWDIDFICDDSMTLSKIADDRYDFVYTSNGTYTWINNINLMHKNIFRVLKHSGVYIMYDIHPFTRPFQGYPGNPIVIKSYEDTAPHNHWRIQDLINSMTDSGFRIIQLEEMFPIDASYWFKYDDLIKKTEEELVEINNWKHNPMAAIPAWISICVQK